MKEALYYAKIEGNSAKCALCPHNCLIAPGKTGICRIRQNKDGALYSLTYGEATSINLDPIEKKPLYHYKPGSMILSVGAVGCNFRCGFCQNWEISQASFGDIPMRKLSSEMALSLAKENKSIGIAYTYNEPLVNFEWVLDTAKLFFANGMKNVIVSNGYINPEPLAELMPYINAANIDVKSFTEKFYKGLCGGKLEPVLKTVEALFHAGKHVEVTTLLIPGENDSAPELEKLAEWLAGVNNSIPLHFSRFFPQYKMERSPTEKKTLITAYELARKKLKYVYIGNIWEQEYSQTYCPECGETAVSRDGYDVKSRGKEYKCPKCGADCGIKP
jgi:pyruvate formate lyase activating enzyme